GSADVGQRDGRGGRQRLAGGGEGGAGGAAAVAGWGEGIDQRGTGEPRGAEGPGRAGPQRGGGPGRCRPGSSAQAEQVEAGATAGHQGDGRWRQCAEEGGAWGEGREVTPVRHFGWRAARGRMSGSI